MKEIKINERIIEIENDFALPQLLTFTRSASQMSAVVSSASLNALRKTSSMRNINIFNENSSRLQPLHAQIKDVQMKDVESIYIDLHIRTKVDSSQRITYLHSDMKNDRRTISNDDSPSYMYKDHLLLDIIDAFKRLRISKNLSAILSVADKIELTKEKVKDKVKMSLSQSI